LTEGQLNYDDSTEVSCLAGIRAFSRVAKRGMLMEDAVVKQKLAMGGECVIPSKTWSKGGATEGKPYQVSQQGEFS